MVIGLITRRCVGHKFADMYDVVFVEGALMYLNEATLLNNVKQRYLKNKIYVSIK